MRVSKPEHALWCALNSGHQLTQQAVTNPEKVWKSRTSFCLLEAKMTLIYLLMFFATPGGLSANFRGYFVPPQTNLSLVEGDIAVPETHLGTGQAVNAFLNEPTKLWPRGYIPYRIETFEWDGIVEPIFLDDQIENITTAHQKIMTSVPCLKFQ